MREISLAFPVPGPKAINRCCCIEPNNLVICLKLLHPNSQVLRHCSTEYWCSMAFVRSCKWLTTLSKFTHTNAEQPFLGFCLQTFCQDGPPQRVNCWAPIRNARKVSFPKTQLRIVGLGSEQVSSNLSITNPTSINRAIAAALIWLFNKRWR